MNPENLLMLELTCEHLDNLLSEVVFVGGATVELWITDQAAPEFRRTEDIDVVVEVTTRQAYYRLEEQLRSLGLDPWFRESLASRVVFPRDRGGAAESTADPGAPSGRGSPEPVQSYVAERMRELSGHRDFDSGVEGALPASPESRDRVDLVILPRIRTLIGD